MSTVNSFVPVRPRIRYVTDRLVVEGDVQRGRCLARASQVTAAGSTRTAARVPRRLRILASTCASVSSLWTILATSSPSSGFRTAWLMCSRTTCFTS